MTSTQHALIARIEAAWADASYPGDNDIAIAGVYDFGLSEYFRGTTWRGHSFEKLRLYCFDFTSLSTPRAYAYWLPAYLRAAVEDPHELSQGVDALVNSVTPKDPRGSPIPGHAMRLNLLSEEQLKVTMNVIECLPRTFAPGDRSFARQVNASVEYLRSLIAARAGAA